MTFIKPDLYLPAPDLSLDDGKVQEFERLWAQASESETTCDIEYDSPYPKYEFLSYLVEHKNLLLHGSNHMSLEVVDPVRTSTSKAVWQKLDAVYACSDGIWPIFYAIVDRKNYSGSLRNECLRLTDARGCVKKFYYFALNIQMLRKRVWTDGMIYVLKRDDFEQLTDQLGNLLEEWVSKSGVRPCARLLVTPKDFPFLHQVSVQREKESPQSPTNVEKIAQPIPADIVGQYDLAPDLVITLTRTNEYLLAQAPGCPSVPLVPESNLCYSLAGMAAHLTFIPNEQGEIKELILKMDGREMLARKRS
jgi:hypothetical protein